MEQLDDLLAGAEVVLSGEVLDRIDAIVPMGADVGQLDIHAGGCAPLPEATRQGVHSRPASHARRQAEPSVGGRIGGGAVPVSSRT